MNNIEDDVIAILAVVREQQNAIERAVGAVDRAAGTVASDHVKLSKVAEDVKSLVEASKTAAEAGAEAGVKKSLAIETKALGGSINAAVKRIDDVNGPLLFDRLLYSLGGAFVGGSMVLLMLMALIKFHKLPVEVTYTFDAKAVADSIIANMPQQQQHKKR